MPHILSNTTECNGDQRAIGVDLELDRVKMKDSRIVTTHADVHPKETPSTSDAVMRSGESSPGTHNSVRTHEFDELDEARPGKISPTTPLTVKPPRTDLDAEAIEVVAPTMKILPSPEPSPKIELNGKDHDKDSASPKKDDDACVISCIYFAQQCCECTIL